MIKCNKINLRFPSQVICTDLSFELGVDESICFSGSSGKGKSSLLKVIMGFLKPQSGTVQVKGLELNSNNIDEIRNEMVWLPQNSNLPVNSGTELMNLLEMDKGRREQFRYFLNRLDVLHCGEKNLFSQVSVGQKQRIVMAACLSLDKPILLLDEPVSALDDRSIDLLFETLDTMSSKTIVSTSHNKKWVDYCKYTIAL